MELNVLFLCWVALCDLSSFFLTCLLLLLSNNHYFLTVLVDFGDSYKQWELCFKHTKCYTVLILKYCLPGHKTRVFKTSACV